MSPVLGLWKKSSREYLFFQTDDDQSFLFLQLSKHTDDSSVDRASAFNKWKTLKTKRKAKWIKMAIEQFKDHEEKVKAFYNEHPGWFK
jgi:hypothetical protein